MIFLEHQLISPNLLQTGFTQCASNRGTLSDTRVALYAKVH